MASGNIRYCLIIQSEQGTIIHPKCELPKPAILYIWPPHGFRFSRRGMTGGGGGCALGGLRCSLLIIYVGIVTGSPAGKDRGDDGEFIIPDPPLVEQYPGNILDDIQGRMINSSLSINSF